MKTKRISQICWLIGLVAGVVIVATPTVCYSVIPTYVLENLSPTTGCTSVDLAPDGERYYARHNFDDWDEGYVAFDANTHALVQEYRFGSHVDSAPWAARVSGDSDYLYYTTYYAGAVKKRDVITGGYAVPPGSSGISVGSWPAGLAFDSQRRYLYVGENCPGTGATGSIQVIDTTTDLVVGSGVALNGQPGGTIVVSPDDQYVYTVTLVTTTETLYKIRTSDQQVVGTLALAGVWDSGFSLSPDGNTAYVPDASADKVHVIDTTTMTETDLWDVNDPDGFWVSPDGTHALVTSVTTTQADIQIFDLATKSVIQIIPIGPLTNGGYGYWPVCWDWDEGLNAVYVPVSAHSGGGVAVLTPEPATLGLVLIGGLALLRRRRGAEGAERGMRPELERRK